ncbi:DNA mismatch repair protein MutS [Flavobacteriaceae bacterium]|jgi:hypothetical protein|nr:DNA mismatch repair protein MutS [Flavobacteriaceae bacterium]
MSFKKGDFVEVIDEDFSGEVVFVTNDLVTIQTNDDFLLEFSPTQLIHKGNHQFLNAISLMNLDDRHKIVTDKVSPKSNQRSAKRKERNKSVMEVDLHIEQLIPNSRGMSNYDMLTCQLETVKRQLAFAKSKKIQRIVFIHGVGEGVLKLEMEYVLKRYEDLTYYDADYQKYGFGATEVCLGHH